ncbi:MULTISPECIES: olefin beta-lactone synthetase [unclassified Shewanella]|uniref:olefin beta-lactone synthetase n=1 Tax=unclassified Shewanella TaxID=196818 RepID=UPI0020067EE4|nr:MULTISPECIES: fatty acid CoA ligase family protein [unclassified Shewanella]MCK7635821.1 fatty acid CoA ligase family protein [Shewanella sp. JNE17]MCK7650992.1 fatty acid CoA ligase family protein [Shewanella sp. JNE8]MCK7659196.1 fatty acid CoA ligase family protein [Shewanella sp. JNE4-2]UPO32563.1 fatty acid CoA ligase family protein [Shewanella sp. JNE2]
MSTLLEKEVIPLVTETSFSTGTSQSAIASDANICRHLKQAAHDIPHHLAVAVQSAKGASVANLRYSELDFLSLDRQSDVIAFALNAHGITRGMKAVLMVTPSLDFFALTFALFKAGIIPILVDPGMGIKNLKQCFAEAAPDAFIGIPKAHIARRLFGWGKGTIKILLNVDGGKTGFAAKLNCMVTGAMSLSTLLQNTSAQSSAQKSPYPMVLLKPNEMAAILFTSGSTGTPKGVVYSHAMFEAQIQALKNDYGICHGERDLATFPLFSLFGPALGMASIVPEMDASKPITANPEFLFAAIEQYQCSNIFVNPALLERLGRAGEQKQHTLPSVKRVISAGAPATIASIARFSKMLSDGVPVLNSYGATESLPISMIASDALFATTEMTDNGAGICVGHAIDGVSIGIIGISEAVIPEWDDALLLKNGEIGEIIVQGPMVSQSYYQYDSQRDNQRDSATAMAKIWDPVANCVRHRMGDLGYLDDQGRLWMCGRKAHRVDATHKGKFAKRYYSIPCERIFNTHPNVKRSALVGVKVANEITPLICIELDTSLVCNKSQLLYQELTTLAEQFHQTQGIKRFLIHPDFPVDVRHNAKIFREKLAVWAQSQTKG